MFVVMPTELSTNLTFTPKTEDLSRVFREEIIANQARELLRLREEARDLRDRLATAEASKEEYRGASVALSKQLAECMIGHKRLHQEKHDLFNETCTLRREIRILEAGNFTKNGCAPVVEENIVFRLKPHAYQSQKLQGALREIWPKIDIPPVSIKDLVITCKVLDFVRFLMARDAWGAQNSWKDINAHFEKPRKKHGPSHRIDLT